MIEQNNPIDITREELDKYKKPVEDIFTKFYYGRETWSLPELMRRIDSSESYVMSDIERDTYLAVREGFQLFKVMASLLSDKVGLNELIVASGGSLKDQRIEVLNGFVMNYATFAASRYASKKLDILIERQEEFNEKDKPDLSMLSLDYTHGEDMIIKRLLIPLFANLINHEKTDEVFKAPIEFPVFSKQVFDKYTELSFADRDAHPDLEKHLTDYQFRILDHFLILQGYEDKTLTRSKADVQKGTFQPITAGEIVGNRSAKRKIKRYVERLALYDITAQNNPVLELGGLAWSFIYDGLPGTGKTSLFRYFMTLLMEYSERAGIAAKIITVDQSIKDEFYGKTGKILLQRLGETNDPDVLTGVIFDDIDLLTTNRDDAQGADNDINNILMQYLDGAFTVRKGNVTNAAASNKPTGLDDAMRNRFNDRLLVDGPTTAEDFADMLQIMGGKLFDRGLLIMENGYEPFLTQDIPSGGGWSNEDVSSYIADEFVKYKNATVLDFGKFMKGLKDRNPKITGRSTRAIIEAIKERSADFDVPDVWFENRTEFLDRPFVQKINLLSELYTKITPDILYQEAQRYFDSEQRYALTEAEGHVTRGYNNLTWDIESQIQFYEEQIAKGIESDLHKLNLLKKSMREIIEKRDNIVKEVSKGK